jgi:hypothetical protein
MHVSRRLTVGVATIGLIAAGIGPAVAKGGGSGGGGNSGKPSISFKSSSFTVTEGAKATIGLTRNGTGVISSVTVEPSGPGSVGSAPAGTVCTPNVTPPDYQTGTDTSGLGSLGGYDASFSKVATTASVLIQTCNDAVYEGNRTVVLSLDNFVNGQPGPPKQTAILTIVDNDPRPVLSIGNAAPVVEGNTAMFPVHFNGTTLLSTPIHVTTADGTAFVGVNYTSIGSTFDSVLAPGTYVNVLLGNVAVPTLNDGVYAAPLHFTVVVTATNASVSGSPATGTITDAGPLFAAGSTSDWQGNTMSIPVTVSYQLPFDSTVHWSTVDGTAVGGANCTTSPDYVTSGGIVTIPANTSSANVSVPTCAPASSTTPALDKQFTLALVSPSFGSIGGNGTETIKSTVPYNTIVQASPSTQTENSNVTETITVTNMSGDGLPGVPIRGELWRDNVDPGADGGLEVDGVLIGSAYPVLTDANGQVFSTYTNPDTQAEPDYLYACVPGFALATTSSCGVDLGQELGDSEENLFVPTAPSTIGMATVLWTP